MGVTRTIGAMRSMLTRAALFAAFVTMVACASSVSDWQRDSCDPAAYRLTARMVMSGAPAVPALEWHLANVSTHDVSGCRYFPFSLDLRTATGQPLLYSVSNPRPEICARADEFHLTPGDVADWTEPLGKTPIIEPIVSGQAVLTLVRSSFAHPATDRLCTITLPVFSDHN